MVGSINKKRGTTSLQLPSEVVYKTGDKEIKLSGLKNLLLFQRIQIRFPAATLVGSNGLTLATGDPGTLRPPWMYTHIMHNGIDT